MMTPEGKEGRKIGTDDRNRSSAPKCFSDRGDRTDQRRPALRERLHDFRLPSRRFARERPTLGGLFFVNPPAVAPVKLGGPVTTSVLDGANTQKRDVYYSINLPAADYKVSVEYRRLDQKDSNVGGFVSAFDEDGDHKVAGPVVEVIDIGPAANGAAKLSLADEAKVIFRVRADYAKETAVFNVENWTE